MTPDKIKEMVDACYLAKRIRDMLPKLPEGVTPSYIQYLDIIHKLELQGIQVKVSDISNTLEIPRPGVTKTVKEMEEKGYLKKLSSEGDGRVTFVTITEKGEKLSDKFDRQYYSELSKYMDSISDADADGMIRTIQSFYQIIREMRIDLE